MDQPDAAMALAQRQLCFGGSFNPIHNGHLACAAAVAAECGFNQVVLIPSSQPPHKADVMDIAPPHDRLAMCRLATAGSSRWAVSDIEMRRPGPSYTLDTVRALKAQGASEVTWLIGADMAHFLPQWHEPATLLAETRFLLMARPGWEFDWDLMPAAFRFLEGCVVKAPLINISSTEVRRRVAAGEPIIEWVPSAVAQYIADHRLYLPG